MSKLSFWDKVLECKHENLYDDFRGWFIMCSTPYCNSIGEIHCRDCGAFITECDCLTNSGISGWSMARWRQWEKKKYGNS